MSTEETDPYELLRRAKGMLDLRHEDHARWLRDFKLLPGARLRKTQVLVLRNPQRRITEHEATIQDLLEREYLQTINHIGRHGSYTAIRLTRKGREALRLRENV